MLQPDLSAQLTAIVGAANVRDDDTSRLAYGTDGVKGGGRPADFVVVPGNASEISQIVRACAEHRVPFVPRGAGTGYSGGAVPIHGGVVISLERMNRILEIDEASLVAVVEPNVITGHLQDAVEKLGLFYPPDPASLAISSIGGNVAECAGGPRAFKYGTTKQYVLGLEAVLPTGEIVETGGKAVKNVVGYDLTHLLVGSEGTLAIITKIILRLVPKPPLQSTLRAAFRDVSAAAAAVVEIVRRRIVPSALELIDGECLDAVSQYLQVRSLAPADTAAMLLIEVDGGPQAVAAEAEGVEAACRAAGATELLRADGREERAEIWSVRRDLTYALKLIAPVKFNHDVVVPKGRIPELFSLVARLRREHGVRIPCFGHAGDGNIHVNIMLADDADEIARGRAAERALFEGVVALEGSISGEHGIGFTKKPFIGIELSADEIALMKRVKQAFDPHNLLNPGKIFPA
ncbi:MAG TPA: FAD-linked oxidase C-terminal domain-containing protein [Vicinamibacterales bacterium]|nr:FAD-linked oxidase C-terminal domain-containing protein [Vicinamibacterales bacterium]